MGMEHVVRASLTRNKVAAQECANIIFVERRWKVLPIPIGAVSKKVPVKKMDLFPKRRCDAWMLNQIPI
jgi:hypothetical protein